MFRLRAKRNVWGKLWRSPKNEEQWKWCTKRLSVFWGGHIGLQRFVHVQCHFQPLPTELVFAYFDRGSHVSMRVGVGQMTKRQTLALSYNNTLCEQTGPLVIWDSVSTTKASIKLFLSQHNYDHGIKHHKKCQGIVQNNNSYINTNISKYLYWSLLYKSHQKPTILWTHFESTLARDMNILRWGRVLGSIKYATCRPRVWDNILVKPTNEP